MDTPHMAQLPPPCTWARNPITHRRFTRCGHTIAADTLDEATVCPYCGGSIQRGLELRKEEEDEA